MTITAIIITILVGALIGWLASLIMKSSHGFIVSCIIGIVGSCLGGWLAGILGISVGGLLGTIIVDVVGACILIALLRLILGKRW